MKSNLRRVVSLISVLFCANVMAESPWDDVQVTSEHLRNGIYAIMGKGGNLAVSIGDEGTFLVDDQYAPLTDKIIAEIKALDGQTPQFLINTHWHNDHSGGNENFGKQGSIIIAHHNVRSRMSIDNEIKAFNTTVPKSPKQALPILTFGDDMHMHLNGDVIEVVHIPNAHTDGDSVIYFKNADVLHTGDIWFNGMYPFIDVEHGGSLAGMVKAATLLINKASDNTLIIPGHGPVGNKVELVRYRDMLQVVLDRLQKFKQRGLTIEQVLAEKPTSDFEQDWGQGFLNAPTWLTIIYGSVKSPAQNKE